MYITRTQTFCIAAAVLLVSTSAWADTADDQYTLAAGYYSQSRWQEAADGFRAFLKVHASHPRAEAARFFLGEALVQVGSYDEAHTAFNEYLKHSTNDRYARQALFRSGESAYLTGKAVEAKKALQDFRQQYPDDPLGAYALPYLGDLALQKGDLADSESSYRTALSEFPGGPLADDCRFGLGRTLERRGEFAEAERFFAFLIDNQSGTLADDAKLQLGLMQYNRGQYAEAEATLLQFEQQFADSGLLTHALYWLGMSQTAQDDWQSASDTFARATADAEHPLAAAIEFSAGEASRKLGRHDEAIAKFARVLELWPDSEWADDSLQASTALMLEDGEYQRIEELAAEFDRRYRESPLRPLVRQSYGRALLQREEYDAAIAVFEDLAAVPVRDKLAMFHQRYFLALAYMGAGRSRDALRFLDQIELADAPTDLLAGVHLARATALFELQQYERAVEPLKSYLALQPDAAESLKCRAQLAVALGQNGRIEEAFNAHEELRGRDSKCPHLLPTTEYLADKAYESGDLDVARQLFQQLSTSEADEQLMAKGLAGLGRVQVKQDDPTSAIVTFAQLTAKYPDSPHAAEAALERARLLSKLGQRELATTAFDELMSEYARSARLPHAMLAAARHHEAAGKVESKKRAAQLLERLVAEFPQFEAIDAALYQWAWILVDLGRAQDADAVFERLHDEHRDSRYWGDATYRLAERAARAKQNQQAGQLVEEILQSHADADIIAHALYMQGQLAAAAQKWADVADSMQRLVTSFPDNALRLPAEYWIAESHYRTGNYDQAALAFDELDQKTEGKSDDWLAMIPLRKAQILLHRGEIDAAYELAAPIAQRHPKFRQQYEVDYVVGRYLAHRGRFGEAREAYERVVRSPVGGRTETAAIAQWMIGETHFHQKQYDEAIKAYHRVESLFAYPTWQAAALLQAGKCYEQQGDLTNAAKMYAQILTKYADTSFAAEATQRLAAVKERASVASRRGRR